VASRIKQCFDDFRRKCDEEDRILEEHGYSKTRVRWVMRVVAVAVFVGILAWAGVFDGAR
jgi:hypothetical protein